MNTYKNIFIFIFAFALLNSCKNSIEPTENETETAAETMQVVLDKSLLERTKMTIGEIVEQDFYDVVQATGAIEMPANSKADISPMFSGFVNAIPYLVGDKAEKGSLMFQLQNPEFITMQQSYLKAGEELKFLQSEFERQKLLANENLNSKKNFQKASSDYQSKLAEFNGMKEMLALLNVDLSKLDKGFYTSKINIYAPINGFVSGIYTSIGTYVSPGDRILTLINTAHKHLELEVFEKDVLKIENGQKIRFRVPDAGNEYYEGSVFQVNKAIDMDKRTLLVLGHIGNESLNFLQGMYVEAEILTEEIKGLAVPTRAVAEENGQSYILRFVEETNERLIFEKVFVKFGRINEQYSQIIDSELKAGDKIMDKGVFRLIGN
ncbi:MAG: efflux RND transporter periplasmic adaptor subunit [Bacteroidota bacterium]